MSTSSATTERLGTEVRTRSLTSRPHPSPPTPRAWVEHTPTPTLTRTQVDQMCRSALEACGVGMIVCAGAPPNEILYVNPQWCRITGYSSEEAVGHLHGSSFLQGPGTNAAALDRLRHAFANAERFAAELVSYRKDGTPFWNSMALAPVFEDGKVAQFIGTIAEATATRDTSLSFSL